MTTKFFENLFSIFARFPFYFSKIFVFISFPMMSYILSYQIYSLISFLFNCTSSYCVLFLPLSFNYPFLSCHILFYLIILYPISSYTIFILSHHLCPIPITFYSSLLHSTPSYSVLFSPFFIKIILSPIIPFPFYLLFQPILTYHIISDHFPILTHDI